MRWKLVVVTSLTAAVVACGLWSTLAIGIFGSARAMARSDSILLSSLIVPLSITALASFFIYRHTARKRKTQAVITVLLAFMFTPIAYIAAWILLPDKLYIPRTYEVRHAR